MLDGHTLYCVQCVVAGTSEMAAWWLFLLLLEVAGDGGGVLHVHGQVALVEKGAMVQAGPAH